MQNRFNYQMHISEENYCQSLKNFNSDMELDMMELLSKDLVKRSNLNKNYNLCTDKAEIRRIYLECFAKTILNLFGDSNYGTVKG